LKQKKFFLWQSYDRKRIHPKPLLRQLMFPLTALILLFSLGVAILLYQQYYHYLHDSFNDDIVEINHDMQMLLDEQTSALSMVIKPIASDPKVHKGLREKDATLLLRQWQEVFQTMKDENALTHFYFMDRISVIFNIIYIMLTKVNSVELS